MTMTLKHDIEQTLLRKNQHRFSQASHTPFLKEPLFSLVGGLADTSFAQSILDRNVPPLPSLVCYISQLIQALQRPATIPPVELWTLVGIALEKPHPPLCQASILATT